MVAGSNPAWGAATVDTSRYLFDTLQDEATYGSPGGASTGHRRLLRFAGVLAVVLAALGVFAWQQGDDDGGGGPLNAIAAAAEKTQKEPGGRAAMHSIVTVSGKSAPFTMTGRIVFDAEDHTRGVITAPHTVSGGPMRLDVVSDGTIVYMRSSKFDSLPDGAKWMSLDLSLGDEMDPTALPEVDAKGELALLEGVDNAQKLGKEDVRGVSTTHYRGALSIADQADRARDAGEDNIASVAERHGGPTRVDAWIDAEGLVRRMRLIHSQPAEQGEKSLTIDMRMDFFDFGFEPEIEVPDSSEVFDATDLTREKLGIDN
jgi:hypothetical protein